MTLIIETDTLSYSDIKKLHHFIKVTLYPLILQRSIFIQKAERQIIALLKQFERLTLSPLFLLKGRFWGGSF